MGINIVGEKLKYLRFVDDIILMTDSVKDVNNIFTINDCVSCLTMMNNNETNKKREEHNNYEKLQSK